MRFLILLLFIGVTIFSCEDEQTNTDDLQAQMNKIEEQINTIISKDCSSTESCQARAIGVKPCGGPTHFIIYASMTSESELTELINQYDELNRTYNEQTGIGSDCAIVSPPELECSSGMCVEIE